MFGSIASRYDLMSELLSYGRNRAWRRFLVSRMPPEAIVLDVATGTASVALDLARTRGARVVGLDPSEPMLRRGARRVAKAGLGDRIALTLGRAERLPFPDAAFEALTFTYLLRYVDDPGATLVELARVVRPGGVMAALEFGVPENRVWRAGWSLQTSLVLPAVGALASRAWRDAGRFLGRSVREFNLRYPPWRQAEMWREAGMRDVRVRPLTFGAGVVTWGVRDER